MSPNFKKSHCAKELAYIRKQGHGMICIQNVEDCNILQFVFCYLKLAVTPLILKNCENIVKL